VAVAATAALLARRAQAREATAASAAAGPIDPAPPAARRLALAIAAASGAAALANETLWTRTLVSAVGDNSAYAFAEMLAAVLVGLALGGTLAAPWVDRVRRPLVALGALQVAAAVAAAASAAVLDAPGRGGGVVGPWGDSPLPWSSFVRHGVF